MKPTRIFLFSLLTLVTVARSHAQQEYLSKHYGNPGTTYLYNAVYGFNQDSMLIQSGPDLTWDLSNTNVTTHLSKIVTKEQAFDYFTYLTICNFGGTSVFDCANIWNSTDQAWVNIDTLTLFNFSLTNSQRYQKRTNTLLLENFLGFKADIGSGQTPAVVVYSNPDTILHFPVVYGDHYTSSIHWQVDLNPVGQNTQYYSHQTRSTTIDGWGKIITPLQTFENTVRMRSEILRVDTLTTDAGDMPINIRQVEYMWFDTAYKLPVMIALGVITDTSEVLSSIQYLWDKTCAAPTWTASVANDTYTIDSTGSVTIDFTIDNGNADEYTWDWGDGQVTTTTGSTTHTFTEPGMYEVGLTACMTNCLPLNSCSFDLLDFVILADHTLPGEESGIKIYPNPVGSQINLFVPEAIGSSHFIVMDMNGKEVLKGLSSIGLNSFSSSLLPDGMYAMQIMPEDSKQRHNYALRFIVARQ
jgi:PKD repeat protein